MYDQNQFVKVEISNDNWVKNQLLLDYNLIEYKDLVFKALYEYNELYILIFQDKLLICKKVTKSVKFITENPGNNIPDTHSIIPNTRENSVREHHYPINFMDHETQI